MGLRHVEQQGGVARQLVGFLEPSDRLVPLAKVEGAQGFLVGLFGCDQVRLGLRRWRLGRGFRFRPL